MTLIVRPGHLPGDQYFSNVSLLLHGNGSNNSTTIIDNSPSPKTLIAVGDAKISTTQSKYGGSSIFMDGGTVGSDDYLTMPVSTAYDFDGDFTLEAWIWKSADGRTSVDTVFSTVSNGSSQGLFWEISATAGMRLRVNGAYRASYNYDPNTSSWQHVAAARASGTIRLFLNGSVVATASYADAAPAPGYLGNVYVGAVSPASGYFFNGYIDELRITKGIARYVEGTGANAGKMVFAGTNTLALPTEAFADGYY